MTSTPCRGCGKDVLWAIVAATGNRMPLDPIPILEGNVETTGDFDHVTGAPLVKVLRKGETGRLGADRHLSHFATCDFRRKP